MFKCGNLIYYYYDHRLAILDYDNKEKFYIQKSISDIEDTTYWIYKKLSDNKDIKTFYKNRIIINYVITEKLDNETYTIYLFLKPEHTLCILTLEHASKLVKDGSFVLDNETEESNEHKTKRLSVLVDNIFKDFNQVLILIMNNVPFW